MRILFALIFTTLPAMVHAHAGHLAEAAGHDHVIAGVAIGVAIGVAVYGWAKGRGGSQAGNEAPNEETQSEEASA